MDPHPDSQTIPSVHATLVCLLLPLLCMQLALLDAECSADPVRPGLEALQQALRLSPLEAAAAPVPRVLLRLERLLRLRWMEPPQGFAAVRVAHLSKRLQNRLLFGRSLSDLEQGRLEGSDEGDPLVTGACVRGRNAGPHRLCPFTVSPRAGVSCLILPKGHVMRHPADPQPSRNSEAPRDPEAPLAVPKAAPPLSLADTRPGLRVRDASLRLRDTVYQFSGLPAPSAAATTAAAAGTAAGPEEPWLGPWQDLQVRLLAPAELALYRPGRPPFVSAASERRVRARLAVRRQQQLERNKAARGAVSAAPKAPASGREKEARAAAVGAGTAGRKASHVAPPHGKAAAQAAPAAAAAPSRAVCSAGSGHPSQAAAAAAQRQAAYCEFCRLQTTDVVEVRPPPPPALPCPLSCTPRLPPSHCSTASARGRQRTLRRCGSTPSQLS